MYENKKQRLFTIFKFNIIVITSETTNTNIRKYTILYIYKYYFTIV